MHLAAAYVMHFDLVMRCQCCEAARGQADVANLTRVSVRQAMEGTKKRLIISAVLTNMFRSVLALSPGAAGSLA